MEEYLKMNKNEFMSILKSSLSSMNETEKNDILYDYEEHFRIGMENGKSEDKIVEELGDPSAIGDSYYTSSIADKAFRKPVVKNTFKVVLAAIGLGFFNLVFVLGPYLGFVGVILGLFGTAIGLTVAGFAYFICVIIFPNIPDFMSVAIIGNKVISLLVAIGLTALGLLLFIGMCYLSRGFYKLTVKYLELNKKIITQ